jgi:hypothetical protein
VEGGEDACAEDGGEGVVVFGGEHMRWFGGLMGRAREGSGMPEGRGELLPVGKALQPHPFPSRKVLQYVDHPHTERLVLYESRLECALSISDFRTLQYF